MPHPVPDNSNPAPPKPSGWLRSRAFDQIFLLVPLILACMFGGLAFFHPQLFPYLLTLDLWLLAYPHVIATFTRTAFNRLAARQHLWLLTALPILVLAATAGLTTFGGEIALATVYFYWQTWHYARQSYGLSRAYQRSAGATTPDHLTTALIFIFPLWGLLNRAYQHPRTFYYLRLYSPPIPPYFVTAAAICAGLILAFWLWQRLRHPKQHPLQHTLFVLSHVAISYLSYNFITDITQGWLFINVWHNTQYLLFVWAQNARQFRTGLDPQRTIISWLSQPKHLWAYAAVGLLLSTAVYTGIDFTATQLPNLFFSATLVIHMAFNFHHYVVDALIWKSKKKPTTIPAT